MLESVSGHPRYPRLVVIKRYPVLAGGSGGITRQSGAHPSFSMVTGGVARNGEQQQAVLGPPPQGPGILDNTQFGDGVWHGSSAPSTSGMFPQGLPTAHMG